jgi:hypothetical protein
MLQSAAHKGRFIILAGCAAALIAGAGALRADLMVSHGFAKAFGAQGAPLPFDVVAQSGSQQQVGDEGYWLTRSEVESPAPFAKRLAVGDRITISGRDGRDHTLEVVDLKAIGEPLVRVAAETASPRLLLVTCRLVGATDRDAQSPVRFVIEGEAAPEPPALPPSAAPKTL